MAGIVWWTDERDADLRRLVEIEGRTYAEAAAWLSHRWRRRVSRGAARHRGQALGLQASRVRGDLRRGRRQTETP